MSTLSPTLLANLILVLHAALVLFIVFGQALIMLGWRRRWLWTRNPTLRIAHLAIIALVVAQTWLGISCPLTALESALRYSAGEAGYQSFIGDWLHRLMFYRAPAWVFTLVYTLFGLGVVLTWLGYPPRWKDKNSVQIPNDCHRR